VFSAGETTASGPGGLGEAPVAGAAHTVLGPYWLAETKLDSVRGEALHPRGGVVHCERAREPNRLLLAGQAVTTMKSLLLVSPLS
jgi:predicted PhzF superfamily epimerase YddE/YHI9